MSKNRGGGGGAAGPAAQSAAGGGRDGDAANVSGGKPNCSCSLNDLAIISSC